MGEENLRARSAALWQLQRRQHGVVTYAQLLELGFNEKAIEHRLRKGRLHRLARGVYAVGRREVGKLGRWKAATLACGPRALLSHRSAAALWRIRKPERGPIEVVVPPGVVRRHSGLLVRRLADPPYRSYRCEEAAVPVTCPAAVLVDLTACLPVGEVEAAVNEADHRNLIDPEALRLAIDEMPRRPGTRRLRQLLDSATCVLTSSELERLFLTLVKKSGLPVPTSQKQLGPHRVDFFWPELELIVETDSLRYHRTPFKQSADKRRDNRNVRSGHTTLRFAHGNIRYEPDYVRAEMRATAAMLDRKREGKPPS